MSLATQNLDPQPSLPELATDLWNHHQTRVQTCLQHPFVQGIADGSLARAKFAYYVAQDAFFLDAFARAYSVCAAKAPDFQTFECFHQLAAGVLAELKLHGHYAEQWQVNLQQVTPGFATRRYVDFLTATAWSQPLGVTMAAMAPCMRLYAYLGQTLAQDPMPDHAYAGWIKTYSDPVFEHLAQQLETQLNQGAAALSTSDQTTMATAYGYAMQCELDFFQAAWEVEA